MLTRPTQAALVDTPLQRGAAWRRELKNRFNGFSHRVETVEPVSIFLGTINTPLKRGVNEKWHRQGFSMSEISGLGARNGEIG